MFLNIIDFDKKSGKDLPLFSRSGKSTIPMHMEFKHKSHSRKSSIVVESSSNNPYMDSKCDQ
jgi:hypothetical protein